MFDQKCYLLNFRGSSLMNEIYNVKSVSCQDVTFCMLMQKRFNKFNFVINYVKIQIQGLCDLLLDISSIAYRIISIFSKSYIPDGTRHKCCWEGFVQDFNLLVDIVQFKIQDSVSLKTEVHKNNTLIHYITHDKMEATDLTQQV